MRYKLLTDGPVTIKTGHPLHGRIEVTLSAGRTTPKSEQEKTVFEMLADMDLAERIPETKAEEAREEEVEMWLETAPTEQIGEEVTDDGR